MNEIRLTDFYYKEYHRRRQFIPDADKVRLYQLTQTLHKNWPKCMSPSVPPEMGTKHGLHYIKCDYNFGPHLRVAFGIRALKGITEIVALTCRTKEELGTNADRKWYDHMRTIGRDKWDEYRRGLLASRKIY